MCQSLENICFILDLLKSQNKNKTVTKEHVLYNDISQLKFNQNRMFYGVLTIGSNVESAILQNGLGGNILTISSNQQIIELFSALDIQNMNTGLINDSYIQFKGYEINIS